MCTGTRVRMILYRTLSSTYRKHPLSNYQRKSACQTRISLSLTGHRKNSINGPCARTLELPPLLLVRSGILSFLSRKKVPVDRCFSPLPRDYA